MKALAVASLIGSAFLFAHAAMAADKPKAAAPAPAAPASKAGCEVEIHGTDTMQFQRNNKMLTEIVVPGDCKSFKVILKHVGKQPNTIMGHNWFLAESKDFSTVVADAGKITPGGAKKVAAKDAYIVPVGGRVLAGSKLTLGGGESETIEFATGMLKKGGDYTFFCTFPGHFGMMKGKLVFN